MKLPPVVCVEWLDSDTEGSPWASIEEVRRGKTTLCHTIGYLVHERDDAVVVALSYWLTESGEIAQVGSPTTIPRVAIKKLRKVKT